MDYNTDVSREFVDNLFESAMWAKGKVKVSQRVDEGTTSQEQYQAEAEEAQISFNYDDLQLVLDNLEDDVLMEHALSMLDVFDDAYETLLEGSDEYEEEEYDEEEYDEEEYDEDELEEAKKRTKENTRDLPPEHMNAAQLAQWETHTGARGVKTTKGGKGGHSRPAQQAHGMTQASTEGGEGSARRRTRRPTN